MPSSASSASAWRAPPICRCRSMCRWVAAPTGTRRRTEPRARPTRRSVGRGSRLERMTAADPPTPPSIHQGHQRWVDALVELSPVLATYIGRNEANGRLDDLSPAGHERAVDAARAALAELDALAPVDDIDAVTKADLSAELRLQIELHDAQWHLRD